MTPVAIKRLSIAVNVCEQVLREVERTSTWSVAHVHMNPLATSLLHKHEKMAEIYVITRGHGLLRFGDADHLVGAGSVVHIPTGVPHMLTNLGCGSLEHLVFALPPFDPEDVHMVADDGLTRAIHFLPLPPVQDCFDGAKIVPYSFAQHDLSIACGWVANDPTRLKQPHYHKNTTEWIYVVEGKGSIEVDGQEIPTCQWDWLRMEPGTEHAIRNHASEDLVVVCICSPMFSMTDVHYRC